MFSKTLNSPKPRWKFNILGPLIGKEQKAQGKVHLPTERRDTFGLLPVSDAVIAQLLFIFHLKTHHCDLKTLKHFVFVFLFPVCLFLLLQETYTNHLKKSFLKSSVISKKQDFKTLNFKPVTFSHKSSCELSQPKLIMFIPTKSISYVCMFHTKLYCLQ